MIQFFPCVSRFFAATRLQPANIAIIPFVCNMSAYLYEIPHASEILPSVVCETGTNAATHIAALNTRGHSMRIVFHPAFKGICAGSRVQKNCSSV